MRRALVRSGYPQGYRNHAVVGDDLGNYLERPLRTTKGERTLDMDNYFFGSALFPVITGILFGLRELSPLDHINRTRMSS